MPASLPPPLLHHEFLAGFSLVPDRSVTKSSGVPPSGWLPRRRLISCSALLFSFVFCSTASRSSGSYSFVISASPVSVFSPATTTTTLFVQMPYTSTFRRLLKAESEAALPEDDDGLDALFASYQVRPDAIPQRGRRAAPSRERLELAAAILWLHTHVNAAPAALDRIPYEMQVLLAECFVADFSLFADKPGWQARLAGFFKFAAPPNTTPPARIAPGRARAGAGPSRRARRSAPAGSSPSSAGRRVDKGVPSGSTADDDSEIEGGDDGSPDLSGGPDSPEREHASSGGPGSTGSGERERRRSSKKKKSSRRSKKKHRRPRSSSSSGGTSSSSSSPSSSDSDELGLSCCLGSSRSA